MISTPIPIAKSPVDGGGLTRNETRQPIRLVHGLLQGFHFLHYLYHQAICKPKIPLHGSAIDFAEKSLNGGSLDLVIVPVYRTELFH